MVFWQETTINTRTNFLGLAIRKAREIFSVEQKNVIVTGASGQLGSAYSRVFLEQGASVVCLDRQRSPSDRLNEKKFPETYRFIEVDLTDKKQVADALLNVERFFGIPNVLVNNAAIDSPPNAPAAENGPFETYPEESWDKVIEANLKTMFLACQIFGNAMASSGRPGSIINVSSIYGLVSPDQSLYDYRREIGEEFFKPVAYSVSKSGVLNFSRYLAVYWASKGVRVNSLTISGVFNNQDEKFLQAYCDRIPVGRMAEVEDYFGPLIFLASDASQYMTGANLVIDGGWTAI